MIVKIPNDKWGEIAPFIVPKPIHYTLVIERFLVFQAKSKANASFNQYVIAQHFARFSCLTSRRGTRYYIGFYLLFSNLIFEVICSITDLTASFLLPSAGISGEGDEDCRDKADAQSRFLLPD